MIPWILITVAILIIILGVIAIAVKKRGKGYKTDYYSLFIMGITWAPFGIVITLVYPETTIGYFFLIAGLAYFAIGLANKNKWDKNRKNLYLIKNDFWRWLVIIVLGLVLLVGILAFVLIGS